MMRRVLVLLRRSDAGVAAVEFALIAPVLLMTIMGLFDLSYNMYTASMLNGAVQKAARDSSIESADAATLDGFVTNAVHAISPYATVIFTRESYTSFSEVSQPEDFTDVDGDGVCNNSEPFEDANGNGTWDTDRGSAGMGSARDAVLYKVTVTYPRAFPIAALAGIPADFTTQVKTVLRNQPYGLQDQSAPALGSCI
jgi:Flp pilus assembly protein TadG